MGQDEQIGFFKIDADDLDGTEKIVPKDLVGKSPAGQDNPDQDVYNMSSDGESHEYYVHVVNDLDVDTNWNIKQSHMFDESLENPVDIFDSDKTVSSGSTGSYSGEENGSYYGVSIDPASNPSSGSITVVIQKSSV